MVGCVGSGGLVSSVMDSLLGTVELVEHASEFFLPYFPVYSLTQKNTHLST